MMRLAFWRRPPAPIEVDLTTGDDADQAVAEARARWGDVRRLAAEQHRLARNNHFRQGFEAALAGTPPHARKA